MSIIRVKRRHRDDVALDRTVIRNQAMTYRARGLLAYLLTFGDEQPINSKELSRGEGTEGRDAVRASLTELEGHGHVERTKRQIEGGKWVTETVIHESPRPGFQASDNRASVSQALQTQNLDDLDNSSTATIKDPRIKRLVKACKHRNVAIEAVQVWNILAGYVDETFIDECVGWVLAAESRLRPERPRYFHEVVRQRAAQRGIAIPPLNLEAAS